MERTLAGWNAGGWLFLLLVIVKMWHADVEGIKSEADIERENRGLVLAMVILGSLFTLLALVAQLSTIKSEYGIDRTISISLSVSTILLSWLLIHTMFAERARVSRREKPRAARQWRRPGVSRRPHAGLCRHPLFRLRRRNHGANLRRRGDLAFDALRRDAARHPVFLLQYRRDRADGQPRRAARAGVTFGRLAPALQQSVAAGDAPRRRHGPSIRPRQLPAPRQRRLA
ncbi:MAG: DUF1345 domain-containing protein [Methyloceanibacter sp.]|uniref:DUF1345 domain-containing protein n=1 Tax=Methyloceanibacter sp. TaxID=1965321 RepID=UPI003D9B82B7